MRLLKVFLAVIASTLCMGACGDQQDTGQDFPDMQLEFTPGQLTEAGVCGACHIDIFSLWQSSQHARSFSNPVFQEAMEDAVSSSGEDVRRLCLRCHAPAAALQEDYEPEDPLIQEGVGCDFCHSLTGTVLAETQNPFVLEVGSVKFGPVEDADSNAHEVGHSEFHTSSLHCAGCHQYTNPNGIEILSTYSEWRTYQASGGDKSCQECHMPLVMANVVDPKVKRVEGSFVNLHKMPGGHSRDQLTKSLRLSITELKRSEKEVYVQVQVKNSGAGHSVPTGSPSRKVVLSLVAETPGQEETIREQRVYQRVMSDSEGRPILEDSDLFLHGRGQSGE